MLLLNKTLLRLARGLWQWILAIAAVSFLTLVGTTALAEIVSQFLGSLFEPQVVLSTVKSAVGAAFLASVFTFLAQLVKGLIEYKTAAKARSTMRKTIFSKVMELDVLPADKKERKEILAELAEESRTMILYEAPHHLVKTLTDLSETLGNRKITLCRELTKKFETILPTTIAEALQKYETEDPRGEYVLVIAGKSREEKKREQIAAWEDMSIEEHMAYYEKTGMDSKSAMKQVAKDRGVGKREIYDYLHKG